MPEYRPPIGGEFEISLESVMAALRAPLPDPIGYTVSSGRTALAAVLFAARAAGRTGPIALPAYVCESIVQPVLEAGMQPSFFGIRDDLTVDLPGLEALVARERPSVVLVVDYFGFPQPAFVGAALRGLRDDTWVVEDCVQGPLIDPQTPLGSVGDFAFTSFRKYLPLPDGGILRAPDGVDLPRLSSGLSNDSGLRLVAKLLREDLVRTAENSDLEDAYLQLVAEAERRLERQVPQAAMSELSVRLLAGIDVAETIRRRRENYAILHEAFEVTQLARIASPLQGRLPPGVSPLVFPVRVAGARRDALRARLAAERIYCPIHWPLPRLVDGRVHGDAARLSNEILGLPVDQRYDRAAMERVLATVEAVTGESG